MKNKLIKLSKLPKVVALVTLLVALSVINWSIYQKETLLAKGQVVYLKLAPVDPRSLMQGDYMALRFAMADNIRATLTTNLHLNDDNQYSASLDGLANVTLDEHNIATFVSISVDETLMPDSLISEASLPSPKTQATVPLQFRVRHGRVQFATNAYFFEEGTGEQLTQAIYGEFRVDSNGELLLVALRDKALVKLGS